MALRVAIMGCPGSGKSTLAADLSASLREAGLPSEFVSEYAREFIASNGGINTPYEQVFMASEQERREDSLGSKDNLILISDSPYILNFIYASLLSSKNRGLRKGSSEAYYPIMMELVYKKFLKALKDYDIIIFTEKPEVKYHNDGVRIHSEQESLRIQNVMRGVIEMHGAIDILFDGNTTRGDRHLVAHNQIVAGYESYIKGIILK